MTGSIILGQTFKSWEEVKVARERYSQEQGVPYTVFNSTLAATFNKHSTPHRQMPQEQKYKDAVIACKHYGKARQSKHEPGKQRRSNQSTFKKYCVAKFNLSYNIDRQCHVVTKLEEGHCNHLVGPEFAKHYPENRRPANEVKEKCQVLFDNEAKSHRIRDVVLNSGVLVTGQDIQNLRNKWLASFKGAESSPEAALFVQLKKLKEDDPNSVVVVHYDGDSKYIQSVFFQTSFMRQNLEQYPEVILMDTTFQLCENDMPLVATQVVDAFGVGQISGYAIAVSENKECVTSTLNSLVLSVPKVKEETKIMYIDKSPVEIASIRDVLPNAEIHLCDFHVKDNFSRANVRNLVEKDKRDEMEKHIEAMRFAHTREDYEKAYQDLEMATGGKDSEFMQYFNKNWHESDLVWCDYVRNESFTLGERTTGRIEAHFGRTKDKKIDKKLPVPEVFSRLCAMNRNAAIENSQRMFTEMAKTKYHKYSADPVIQQIMKVNTPFVGNFLKAQYERSLEPPSESKHQVTLESCDCKYFYQSKLVCSHVFRERRLKGVGIYDHKLVPPRWTVIVSSEAQKNFEQFEIITSPIKKSKSKKPMNQNERYNLAESITKRISSRVASFGGDQFHCYINALQNFEDLLKMGKRVAVVGVDGEGQPDLEQINSNEKSTCEETSEAVIPAVSEDADLTDQGQNIYVTRRQELGVFSALTPSKEKELKLPVKCPIPGRPKGKRKLARKSKKAPTKAATDDDNDVDDPGKMQCTSCNGPVLWRTSCSRKNVGRKYIVCQTSPLPACKQFHEWISDNFAPSQASDVGFTEEPNSSNAPDTSNTDCLVCTLTGPPSLKEGEAGHKCYLCGVPVHAIANAPCCSVAVDPNHEGYGSTGRRRCLNCDKGPGKDIAAASGKHSTFLDDVDLPIVSVKDVEEALNGNCATEVEIQFIDQSERGQTSCPESPTAEFAGPLCDAATNLTPDKELDQGLSQYGVTASTPHAETHNSNLSTPKKKTPQTKKTRKQPAKVPRTCHGCQSDAVLKTARTPKNYGRQFYTCPTWPNHKTAKCAWMCWKKQENDGDSNSTPVRRAITDLFAKPDNPSTPSESDSNLGGLETIEEDDEGESALLNDGEDTTLSDLASFIEDQLETHTEDGGNYEHREEMVSVTQKKDTCNNAPHNSPSNTSGHAREKLVNQSEVDIIDLTGVDSDSDLEVVQPIKDEPSNPEKDTQTEKDTTDTKSDPSTSSSSSEVTRNKETELSTSCKVCHLAKPPADHKCCVICKTSIVSETHNCICIVCQRPILKRVGQCFRCTRPVHDKCSSLEKENEKGEIVVCMCHNCKLARDTGLLPSAVSDVMKGKSLSDEHLNAAGLMLKKKFSDLGGLTTPQSIPTSSNILRVAPHIAYENEDYLQILSTGMHHWVLLIVCKGKPFLMDSNYNGNMTTHTKSQIREIMSSDEHITVLIPQIQQQGNGVDCGLYAIANAVDFAFHRKIRKVSFVKEKLRSHWLACIRERSISLFPSHSVEELGDESDCISHVIRVTTSTDTDSSKGRCENCQLQKPQPGHACCKYCKLQNKRRGHICDCVVCSSPTSNNANMAPLLCKACMKPVHYECAKFYLDEDSHYCFRCKIKKDGHLDENFVLELYKEDPISLEHFRVASTFIKNKFPDLEGLAEPVDVKRKKEYLMFCYEANENKHDYIQFLSTGTGHCVLLVVQEGKPYLLGADIKNRLTSEVESQVAGIVNCFEEEFTIFMPQIDGEYDNTGLLTIAYAMEFAESRKICDVSFTNLSTHWFYCLVEGEIMAFPSSSKQDFAVVNSTITKVYCVCRLPEHYSSSMIDCDKCNAWYHPNCVDADVNSKEWICPLCKE